MFASGANDWKQFNILTVTTICGNPVYAGRENANRKQYWMFVQRNLMGIIFQITPSIYLIHSRRVGINIALVSVRKHILKYASRLLYYAGMEKFMLLQIHYQKYASIFRIMLVAIIFIPLWNRWTIVFWIQFFSCLSSCSCDVLHSCLRRSPATSNRATDAPPNE